jgi:hypothetical protein
MTPSTAVATLRTKKRLLTQNSELRRIGVYNWTLPAFVVKLSDDSFFNCCPNAGVCAAFCYARNGTYNFPTVKQAHVANLERVLYDLDGWTFDMLTETAHPRFHDAHIRIHDAGDFFSDEYLQAWLDIAWKRPASIFYCYTKEVERFRRLVEPAGKCPPNFRYVYSFGGKQDHLIDEDRDRVADIFPDFETMEAAGYTNQERSDLQAIYNDNNRVGIVYNKIPRFVKRLGGRRFRDLQLDLEQRKEARRLERLASAGAPGEREKVA